MKSARQKIIDGVVYLTLSKISLKIFSFAAFLIIVTHLSLKDYGLLSLLFTVLGPAMVLSMLGLEHLVTSDVASARGKQLFSYARQLLVDYLKLSVCLAVLLFVLGWFSRGFLDRFYDADLNYFFWALVALIVGQLGMNFTSIVFESHERFGLSAWLQFGESGLRLLLLLGLFGLGFSLPTVLWTYILSKIGITLIMLPLLIKTLALPDYTREPRNLILKVLRERGKWDSVRTIINIGTDNLAPWLINFFVSTEAVGLFSFAQKVYSTLTTAIPLRKILLPIIASSVSKSRDVARIIIAKTRKILLYGYLLIGAGLIFGSGVVISQFFPEYSGATILLQLMAGHLLIEVYSTGQSEVLYALKRQRSIFAVSMATILVRSITQVLFIFWFGVLGMVISWLITSVTTALLLERTLTQRAQFPLWDSRAFFTFDDYDRIILGMIRDRAKQLFRFKS